MDKTYYTLHYFRDENRKGMSNYKEYKTLTGAYKAALRMIKSTSDFVTIRENIAWNGGEMSGIIETVRA